MFSTPLTAYDTPLSLPHRHLHNVHAGSSVRRPPLGCHTHTTIDQLTEYYDSALCSLDSSLALLVVRRQSLAPGEAGGVVPQLGPQGGVLGSLQGVGVGFAGEAQPISCMGSANRIWVRWVYVWIRSLERVGVHEWVEQSQGGVPGSMTADERVWRARTRGAVGNRGGHS